MNKFKPKNAREKVLYVHFDTKKEIMEALNLSRPTIDNICDNEDWFYKYLPRISKATDTTESEVLNKYWRIRDGL